MRKYVLPTTFLFVCITAYLLSFQGLYAADDAKDQAYPESGVRTGVWNNGQAALWDLNIIDHFHYFGPKERARGHRPEQPIKFSHITHVQKNGMECQFCHWNVTKSPFASIPEVETCAGCHGESVPGTGALKITGTADSQKEEIKKLFDEYIKPGKQIPWTKVHVMPDHVRFTHERHIKAGVNCQSCHGQIPEMEVVERVTSMKMGWCVDCHREQGSSIDCYVCHK
ncbi:MAG: cytochrome c3 family protein [Bdellovibrionales bacterium]|nr:cytochrome c3 family protein [Bdellovibrionales bacterium]